MYRMIVFVDEPAHVDQVLFAVSWLSPKDVSNLFEELKKFRWLFVQFSHVQI